MRHRLLSPGAPPLILILASCSGAPAAQNQLSIDSSPAGLASFFDQECVQQKGADKARRLYQEEMSACWGDSRCQDEITNEVGWIATTRDGQSIKIVYDWRGLASRDPPGGFLGCSIAVPHKLEGSLRSAVELLAIGGNRFRSVEAGYSRALIDKVETWRVGTTGSGLVLTLQHFMAPGSQRKLGTPPPQGTLERSSWDRGLAITEAELAEHADHPWLLKIGVERNQP